MIVCHRFLKTFSAFHRNRYLKTASCGLEKCCFSSSRWKNLFGVPQKNLSIYSYNRLRHQVDIDFHINNDMYFLGELDRFLLNYKDTLYQHTEDSNIKQLKECQLASDILKIIERIESPTTQQLAQTVLTLRGFQKFLESNQENTTPDFATKFHDFHAALKSPSFDKLVEKIVSQAPRMNLEELSCCLLYLHRCNVPRETLMMLVNSFEDTLKNSEDKDITVSALARVCTVFRDFSDLKCYYHLKNLVPIVFRKLDMCSDFETLGRLTVCFQKMVPILNNDSLKMFIGKSRMLLQRSGDPEIESSRARTILKVVLLLSFKLWLGQFSLYEKELLMSLSESVKYLNAVEIAVLHDIALENMECSALVLEIERTVDDWLSHPTAQSDCRKLYILSLFPKLKRSDRLPEKMLKFYSEKPLTLNELYSDMNNFYYWLYSVDCSILKESSDVFWNRILDYFDNFPSIIITDKLLWICLRYLNYHQTRSYYNGKFERKMCNHLLRILFSEKNSILSPKDFVRLSLLIAFFQRSLMNYTDHIWDRIVEHISRFSIPDNMSSSFILMMVLKRLQKTEKFPKFLPHYMNILAALNNNSFEHLSNPDNENFESLNGILRALQYREVVKTSPLFDLIHDRLKVVPYECMDAKHIRDCIVNMTNCSFLVPQLTDTMTAYITAKKENLPPILINHLFNYTFVFGYRPINGEKFVHAVKKITLKNKNNSPGSAIIRTALALCFFHDLPVELTNHIFSVEFFNQVDREIQTSTYKNLVKQIRQNLMELNRAVCLDYPERDIPWFHEKYCKEIETLGRKAEDNFFDDVSRKLGEIIPTKNSVKSRCISPYYHKIDFLIHTNRKGEPVDPDSCAPYNLRKIAILLVRKLSSSNYYKGKGRHELLFRQLELLDYKVIAIDKKIWNSMYMSEPFAKENYLCSQIWPQ